MRVALQPRLKDELILDHVGRIRRAQRVRAISLLDSCGGHHLSLGRVKGEPQHGRNLLNILLGQLGDLSGLQHADGRLLASDLRRKGGLGQSSSATGLRNLLTNLLG